MRERLQDLWGDIFCSIQLAKLCLPYGMSGVLNADPSLDGGRPSTVSVSCDDPELWSLSCGVWLGRSVHSGDRKRPGGVIPFILQMLILSATDVRWLLGAQAWFLHLYLTSVLKILRWTTFTMRGGWPAVLHSPQPPQWCHWLKNSHLTH